MKCPFPQCEKCKGMYWIFVFVVATIFIYWIYLTTRYGMEEAMYHDPLNFIVFEIPYLENCCSWWPISHFLLFLIIGLFYPTCDASAILSGIAWELFEVGAHSMMKIERQGVRPQRADSKKVEYSENWVNGSAKDIVANIAGFYTGKLIRTQFIDTRKCHTKKIYSRMFH